VLTRVPGDAPRTRSFHHREFDAAELAESKGSTTVSVCLPARNEAATVGDIVTSLRTELVEAVPLVDEVLVIDDHSDDRTAQVARRAGARVVSAADVLADHGEGHGKGEVLWKSVFESTGDLIVWCDADITDFGTRFVTGVLGPLLTEPEVGFVKGFYHRPEEAGGGGRVTELVARPLLSMFFPELCDVIQPLSGEYGGRREVLEQVPFAQGYGVEAGLLIDVTRRFGIDAIAQVDLDVRHHRHRPLEQLAPQAMAVAQIILHRAGPELVDSTGTLLRPGRVPSDIDVSDRPPLVELSQYLSRSA
jgi:glucosyl-3-phosphoglycerate synthase